MAWLPKWIHVWPIAGRACCLSNGYDTEVEQSIVQYDFDNKYVKTVAVSAFNKGQKTTLHFGPLRLSLWVLYNLNPVQNDQIYIEAAGTRHYWHDDPLFIFDDTVMHESVNHSDHIRYCLFMDIVRSSDHFKLFNFLINKLSFILSSFKGIFYKNWKTLNGLKWGQVFCWPHSIHPCLLHTSRASETLNLVGAMFHDTVTIQYTLCHRPALFLATFLSFLGKKWLHPAWEPSRYLPRPPVLYALRNRSFFFSKILSVSIFNVPHVR